MRGTEFAEMSAFAAVAERRSFAKAARDLGVSPSSLTQSVKDLEDRLGVRLLNRTTRKVSTTAGASNSSCSCAGCWPISTPPSNR